MGSQKTKRELTPAETTKVQSAIDSFQQKWGMELTARETGRIVERATEAILRPNNEVGIKPAVRNQMFAMLIEKDPGKAIQFRMDMMEKKGKTISDEKRELVVSVAENEGWQAAREELRKATREAGKPRKPSEPRMAGESTARKQASLPKQKEKRAVEPAVEAQKKQGGHEAPSGLTITELLTKADYQNEQMIRAGEAYALWKEGVEKLRNGTELKNFAKQNPGAANVLNDKKTKTESGEYRNAMAEFEAYLEKKGSRASTKEIKKEDEMHFIRLRVLKNARDDLLEKSILAMGGTEQQAKQITTARSVGHAELQYSEKIDRNTMGGQIPEFGVAGRIAIAQLKIRAKGLG